MPSPSTPVPDVASTAVKKRKRSSYNRILRETVSSTGERPVLKLPAAVIAKKVDTI
jgi:hypothetical protein